MDQEHKTGSSGGGVKGARFRLHILSRAFSYLIGRGKEAMSNEATQKPKAKRDPTVN